MGKQKKRFFSEEEVCDNLRRNGLFESYLSMSELGKRLFMDFCTGQNLQLLTYDSIFKYIFYRAGDYRRLEHFLTAVLGFEVQIMEVLPTESEKLVETGSILILDYKDQWMHCGKMIFDTGIQLEYLPHVIYITVDNFRKITHNVSTELEKWIYLIGADTPERRET